MSESTIKKSTISVILALIALVLFIMLLNAPLRLDDWAWGDEIGINRLKTWFDGYNGRYAGDIAIIVLTRLPAFLRALLEIGILLVATYNAYLFLERSKVSTVLFVCLFFLIPLPIFTQTITWASGFANFVISFCFTIFFIRLCWQIENGRTFSPFELFYTALLAITAQLFLENLSIYLICLFGFFLLKSLHRSLNMRKYYTLLLICALVGALIMFSNSSYSAAAAENDATYKTISIFEGSLLKTIKHWIAIFASDLVPDWLANSGPLNIVLAITSLALVWKKKNALQIPMLAIGTLLLAFLAYSIVDINWLNTIPLGTQIQAIVYTGFFLYLALVCALFSRNRFWTLLLMASQVVIVGPLLFVNPIGSRCFFTPYALWCLLATLLASDAWSQYPFLKSIVVRHETTAVGILLAAIFGILLSSTIAQSLSWHVYDLRAKATEYAVTNNLESLTLPEVPRSTYYCFGANVSNSNDYWLGNYKKFYGIPDSIQLSFCPYSEFDASQYEDNK